MVATTTILTEFENCRHQPGFELSDFVAFYKRYNQIDRATLLALIGAETQYLARSGKMNELSQLEKGLPDLTNQDIRKEIADSLGDFLQSYCPLSANFGSLPITDNNLHFLSEIGRGGEGVVYEAIEVQIRRSVAVKVAFPISLGLEAEATVLGQLQHSNVPTLYSYGRLYDMPYFVFQLIRGKSLKSQCYEGAGLTVANAVSIVQKIGSAVEACHAQGIVHCDLNLSNVITSHGNPYLIDFGQARYSTTSPNRMFGTPGRTPPEFLDPNVAISPILGDVYCLGVMLYELLTQSLPQVCFGAEEIAKPIAPSQIRKAVDPELEQICMRAIANSPGDRFQSMKQFNSAINSWIDHQRHTPSVPQNC